MFDNKPIPVTPEVRKRRLEEKKAGKSKPKTDESGEKGTEVVPDVDVDDLDINLAQYVQAKLMADAGFLANQRDCKLISFGFNYLKTYENEIAQNVDTGNQHKNENFLRQESCQAIKKLSEKKEAK